MILKQGNSYFINFQSNELGSRDFWYEGWGTYTGKSMKDSDGNTLYWFEDLDEKVGFTKGGWFSLSDIVPMPDVMD